MFKDYLENIPLPSLFETAQTTQDLLLPFHKDRLTLSDFALLISPAASSHLETMAQRAHELTVQRFGYTINFYTPIYLSNFCVNSCPYCSFNHEQSINRKTLSLKEVETECRFLKTQGFDNILLVSGEDPKEISLPYLIDCLKIAKKYFHQVNIEIYPLTTSQYAQLKVAGLDGVTLYQETYLAPLYEDLHKKGPKSHYLNRLNTMDRAAAAGIKKLNLGFLLGLADWRREALYLAAHLQYLRKFFWQTELAASFPRIRANSGQFQALHPVKDQDLAQLILALRLFDPTLNLVLSTRETPEFRNHMLPLGITSLSAGSKTNPGGYSGEDSGTQFEISDDRNAQELATYLQTQGYETVWKDWELGI